MQNQTDGVQHSINRLFRTGLAGDDAVVIEIPDHRQKEHTLSGLDIRNDCHPFAVRLLCVKLVVQEVFILMYLPSYLLPLFALANF